MHEPDPAAAPPPHETPETPAPAGGTDRFRHLYPMVTGAAYAMLTLLGLLLGLYGGMHYGWLGTPAAQGGARTVLAVAGALLLALLLFVAVRLAGVGMGTRMGALLPATAWFLVTVVMSLPRPEGDLFITGSAAGYAYMFGGCAAVAVAVLRTPTTSTWPFAPIPDMPPKDPAR
ncbi:MAG: hypothetical protein GEV11_03910 [Streptosporangiales bacterium]|nr:hypothetical protein [Streptosporangiales bacterium]